MSTDASLPPKLLLNITHGFQARMLLRSDVFTTLLSSGAEIAVASPNADEPYFQSEFSRPGITLQRTPTRLSRVESQVAALRQYLLMNPALGKTLNHKNDVLRRSSPRKYWVARALNSVLGRSEGVRRVYMAAERRFFPGSEFDDLLADLAPNLIVTGTPGFHPTDAHVLRAAQRHRIPTATVMLSWDNLTSKGCMNGMPDYLIVWSRLMASEAVRYHGYPSERIIECGAAQFDHYQALRHSFDAHAWRRLNGIPDQAALITYGTINPAILPHEHHIVAAIAKGLQAGLLARDAYLWVRIHPQAVRGVFRQSLDAYLALAGPRVRIEVPPVQSDMLAWDLPQHDNTHLASLMLASDVVVTPCSTLILDAACAGTPIISIMFDQIDIPEALSVKRFRYYTHYAKAIETGAIAQAYSIAEFLNIAHAYCCHRSMHATERKVLIARQLGLYDGNAGRRTAKALLCLAGGRPSVPFPCTVAEEAGK